MIGVDSPTATRAESLRRSFDRSFAAAEQVETARLEDLLTIRVGDHPYAIRLVEIAGLFTARRITPLPSPVPELLGLAGFRGVAIPVYDLRALLGHGRDGAPRWLVLMAGETRLGLAFDRLDGHLRLPDQAIAKDDRANGGRDVAHRVAGTGDAARPILHLPSLLDAIRSLMLQVV